MFASGTGSIRPHAVASITGTVNGVTNPFFTYDANGNMLSGAGRTVTWSSFNIPSRIDNQTPAGLKTAAFWYNPEHERIKELQADQSIVVTLSPRYDTGLHWEKRYLSANGQLTGAVEYEHYLYVGGGSAMFGKYITTTATDGVTIASTSIEYYSKDNLGSIVAITDGTGAVKQRLSYDVWGKRRYPNGAADPNGLLNNPDMYHGFTGHEMLDDVGLIHMNGRLYDPVMGRFVSADPTIQFVTDLQSFNRYSYTLNNPLSFIDPSGYSLWTWFRDNVVKSAVAFVVGNAICGPSCGATAAGAMNGYTQTGTLQGTVIGGISGNVSYQIGLSYPVTDSSGAIIPSNILPNAALHAASACVTTAAMGGSCSSAATAQFVTAYLGPYSDSALGPIGGLPLQFAGRMVIGGIGSVAAGGRFEDGATQAFQESLTNGLSQKVLAALENLKTTYFNWRQQNLDTLTAAAKGNPEASLQVAMGLVTGPAGVGRQAASLAEQIVMRDAQAGGGKVIDALVGNIGDPRFKGGDWVKMQVSQETSTGNNITVHYMKNLKTDETTQFKFVTPPQ